MKIKKRYAVSLGGYQQYFLAILSLLSKGLEKRKGNFKRKDERRRYEARSDEVHVRSDKARLDEWRYGATRCK